jgi:hypothetical protein
MHARRIAALTLPVLLLAACGDAPQKVDPPPPAPRNAQAHSADDGHDHSADDGHDHSAPAGGSPSFSGVIVLKGPRAESDSGVLMVSLVSRGQRMPRMSYRLPLTGLPPAVDGERRIPFRLDEKSDMLPGALPAELEGTPLDLSVRFDQDGMVETREGDVTVASPVGWGAEGLEIVVGG